ncbi:G0/G1 switch protein 2 [Cheilinus undulatus]|uniref:G0/G1 switch protein 2 n=1 Tax=Cheilinus undulatus TaxID=241271 RepID=UPI001BD32DD7|nr:G0/G1 switch protein 2 [Cheilinus undulatus]
METITEIIPFTKEMLSQRPGWGMLKIYMLGSTLAMLGAISCLVETVLLPFAEWEESAKVTPSKLILEKRGEKSHPTSVQPEVVDKPETELMKDNGKHLTDLVNRSLINRSHAT